MTKQEQRSLITRFASSQLRATTIAVLRELVTCNWMGRFTQDIDVEAHPFRVSRAKLAARTGLRDTKTVSHSLAILVDKNLLTIIKEVGKTDQYFLHLKVMETWVSVTEFTKAKRQARRDRQAATARLKRMTAKILATEHRARVRKKQDELIAKMSPASPH